MSRPAQKNEINIAKHLEKFQRVLGETKIPVLAMSTGRIDNISYTYPQSYFDIEVMSVTKEELGLVTDNEIERTLTLPPYLSGAYFPSNPDEEGAPSTTRFVGKETVKIDDITYENCDKIILQEAEEQLTGTQKKFEIT